jgi:hypothetical protein
MLDEKITMNQKEMAEILNKYFLSIATRSRVHNNIDIGTNIDASTKYLKDTFSTPFTKMKWRCTASQEIEEIIKSFKTKNSIGYGEITSRIIKASLPYITSPLTLICNAVLRYSVLPESWQLLFFPRDGSDSERTLFTLTNTSKNKTKLHGLSPRANYTDRATAASRRSGCQLLRI